MTDPTIEQTPNTLPKTANKIPNIRRLWHDDKSENFMLEGCLTAVMKAIGESPKYDYPFFLLLSGGFFTQVYSNTKVASSGSTAHFDPDLVKNILDMCGYDYTYINKNTILAQSDVVMGAIKAAIDKGIPVMTKGIGTVPEWSNIGGYGDDGVLLANVYLEDIPTDEHGYIEVKGGLSKSEGLFIIGEKIAAPEYNDVLMMALSSINDFITKPDADGFSFGQKAFNDWADMLEDKSVNPRTAENKNFNADVTFQTIGYYFRAHYQKFIDALPGFEPALKIKEFNDAVRAIARPQTKEYFASVHEMADPEFRQAMAAWARAVGDKHNDLLEYFIS